MNIFLSYASDRRDIAEQVYLALTTAGYTVFFDRDSLPAGDDYHKRIRKSVEDSEAFVFLISPKSVAKGSYTRTELKYAREKWSDPRQRILPVMIEPTEFQQIPYYLRSVTILNPEGSVPAEVMAALQGWHVDAQRTFDPKRAWLEEKLTPRYKIERQLGERNSAMVYKAFDSILQRNAVIKVFVDNRYQDKLDESLREAVRVSDEPSFITIYDACLKEELRYYVMQFIDGPTLRERIDDCAGQWIPVETTRKIFLSIGYALVRAYRKQFNPGNIKPSNIVLTKDDQPFISSLNRFGMLSASRLLQELKSRVPNLGERARLEELAYLLPEQFEEQLETVSPERSAQYMLGLVAYELIMGEIPPTLRSLKELEDKGSLAFQKLPAITAKRPHCPKRIEQIILRMTSRKPRDRYEKLEYALNQIRRVVPSLSMAKDSYQRCTKTPASDTRFFKTFYDEFQRLCPQAKQKFQRLGKQRWQRQHQLLKEAFLMLFVFCEQGEGEEPNILSRVAEMHDHTHHDIPAMFYEPFVDALVHTVCGYPPQIPEPLDPQCVDDESKEKIAQAWRDALAPGIKYMKSKY